MSTVYLQEDFRGSGNLATTEPLAKASGVSAWADSYSGGGAGHAIRAADGVRWVFDTFNAGQVQTFSVIDGTNTKGSGTFVVEIEFRGPLGVTLAFDGFTEFVSVAYDYGGTNVTVQTDTFGPTTVASAAHPYGATNTHRLRIEIDGTTLKVFDAGVEVLSNAYTLGTGAVIDGIDMGTYTAHHPLPTTHALINYIHAVRAGTSGTLGPVGAAGGSMATTIGEVTHFGIPALPGFATGELLATQFGLAYGGILNYAAPIGLVTNFGTPLQTPNKSLAAGSLAPTTVFGEVESVRDFAPEPVGRVTWLAPGTFFGTASVTGAIALTATGIPPNELPAPTSRMVLAATGALVPTNFGTPNVGFSGRASGTKSTAFGTPTTLRPFETTGSMRTAFGTPAVRIGTMHAATGWLSSNIGAASAMASAQRTRSGVFRTRFGLAQAERFVP